MSKEMLVIGAGVWITILPHLGVPSSWKTTLLLITGLTLVVVGFLLRVESLSHGGKRTEHRPFVENTPLNHKNTSDSPADNHAHDRKEGISSLN